MEPEEFECEYDTSSGITVYSFQITEYNLNGWVKCRMIYIHRQFIDGTVIDEEYNPSTMDGTSHYMANPYTARYNARTKTLKVHKGDGTVFSCGIRGAYLAY